MSLQEWAGVPDYDPRATLVVVFTDIIDSTTLTRTVGDREMFDLLVNHFESARTCLLAFEAIEIKLIGDAYMAAFRTSDAALQFALMFRANTGDPRIAIRVGIHVGQVRIKDDDIYGLMVNYAARLAHIKVSGEEGIFLSAAAKRDIESEYGTSHPDFGLFRLSPTQLQGFGSREEVWQVVTREIRVARAARNSAKNKPEARNPKPAVVTFSERRKVPEEPQYKPPRWFDTLSRLPTKNKD